MMDDAGGRILEDETILNRSYESSQKLLSPRAGTNAARLYTNEMS